MDSRPVGGEDQALNQALAAKFLGKLASMNGSPSRPHTLNVIDLARSFSILAVLANHLGPNYLTRPSASPFWAQAWFKLWANGHYGVPIFFVISGYLITRVLAGQPKGLFHPDFRDFYSRRVGRILPLLMLTVLLALLLVTVCSPLSPQYIFCFSDPHTSLNPVLWASIAFFSMNWYLMSPLAGHAKSLMAAWTILWSLSIEEQFYLFYPLLLSRAGRPAFLLACFGFFIALGPVLKWVGWTWFFRDGWFSLNSFCYFGLIALGGLLYWISETYRAILRGPQVSVPLCLAGFLLTLNTYLHVVLRADFFGNVWADYFIGLGTFLFLLGGLNLGFFESKPWRLLGGPGRMSYGMYLLHPLVLFFLWPWLKGLNDFTAFAFFGAVTFGVARLSYRFFEFPINQWIRRRFGVKHSSPKIV